MNGKLIIAIFFVFCGQNIVGQNLQTKNDQSIQRIALTLPLNLYLNYNVEFRISDNFTNSLTVGPYYSYIIQQRLYFDAFYSDFHSSVFGVDVFNEQRFYYNIHKRKENHKVTSNYSANYVSFSQYLGTTTVAKKYVASLSNYDYPTYGEFALGVETGIQRQWKRKYMNMHFGIYPVGIRINKNYNKFSPFLNFGVTFGLVLNKSNLKS